MKLLTCKYCGYQAKQLHQHLKAVHNVSSNEYRAEFGNTLKMQIGFSPNVKNKCEYLSSAVKKSHHDIKETLLDLPILSKQTTKNTLLSNNLYETLFGRAKNRTLLKENPVLYKSIYYHTNELEIAMKMQNSYKSRYSFKSRILYIVEYNYNIENMRCECGSAYSFTGFCRQCKSIKKLWIKNHPNPQVPNYNPSSIPIIEQYGKEHGYNFQHAENGGEFCLRELGYFADGYDKEKNVWIEYDEPHHFVGGKLSLKDIQRQKEIEEHLGCKFIRIKHE